MRPRYLLFAIVFLIAAAPIYAGTVYYVDSVNGSDANNGLATQTPWKTINKVNNSIIMPGDSILFKRGCAWNETLTMPSSGSPGSPITFGRYGESGANPVIYGSKAITGFVQAAEYIYNTPLTMAGELPTRLQIYADGARLTKSATLGGMTRGSWFWSGNTLYLWCPDNAAPSTHTIEYTNLLFGVNLNGKSYLNISYLDTNKVAFHGYEFERVDGTHHVNINNATASYGFRGFSIGGGVISNVNYVLFTDCVGHDTLDEGFWLGHGTENGCVRCEAYNGGKDKAKQGEGDGGGFLLGIGSVNNYILNCYVHDVAYSFSINVEDYGPGYATPTNNIIKYNRIDCLDTGNSVPAVWLTGTGTMFAYNTLKYNCAYGVLVDSYANSQCIYNNVFFNDTSSGWGVFLKDGDNTRIFNNIFYNSKTGPRFLGARTAGTSGLLCDYNVFYRTGGGYYWQGGSPEYPSSLANWRTISGQDMHSSELDPKFVSVSDFHLQSSSPCINTGAYVGLTQDYEGNSIEGTPDIGAYEFGPPTTTTPPMVTTIVPSAIQSTSATGGGIVTADGGATVTARGVCWGLTASPNVSSSHTVDGSGIGSYSSSLTGLSPNATYHVRAYATNSSGTAYGSDIAFTTSQGIALPWVTTSAVTSITSTSAAGGGNVTSDGGVTERGLCWGSTANPTVSGSHSSNGSGTGSYVSSLTGLSPNTTYHVRAYATNSVGTAYGNDIAFTTSQGLTLPSVTTSTVASIASTGATGGGMVTADGGATVTARGVCWGLTANPTVSGSHTADGSGTGSYSSSLTGLSINTTYHVRAYATNSSGTGYGADIPFTTTGLQVYTIPFSESFSGPSLPAGWTTRNEGTGIVNNWAISETPLAGGAPNEASYTWQDVTIGTSRLVSPPIDTTGYSSLYLNFKHVLSTFESGGVTIKVQTSPDGSTWTDESWSMVTSDSNVGPKVVPAMITQNLNRATTYVAFLISGNLHYFDKWYIDDVGIAATPPGTLKAPSLSSPRNGATNQPTIINFKWLDPNTVRQEKGYRIRIRQKGGEYTYYDVDQDTKSIVFSGLSTRTRYYWNMMAVGDDVGSTDSAWAYSGRDRQFTTGTTTTLYAPVTVGAKNAGPDEPTSVILQWQDTNVNPQELSYDVRIKKVGGKYTRYTGGRDAVEYLIRNLQKNTTYLWNVRAKGDRKTTMNSAWGNSGADIALKTGQ
jgi:hypothetical protein